MSRNIHLYLPLLCICLVSLVTGAYSYDAYLRSYGILYNFKVFMESINVVKEKETFLIKINFSIFNPSGKDLKLVYLKPDIYLNGRAVILEEPSFIRFTGLSEVPLSAYKNTTIYFQKTIKNEDFEEIYGSTIKRQWFVVVFVTLKGVPLFELATLQRDIHFEG